MATEFEEAVLRSACRTLGVCPADDLETIRAAWRRLVRWHHPDRGPRDDRAATDRLATINGAWDVVRAHKTARSRPAPAVAASPMPEPPAPEPPKPDLQPRALKAAGSRAAGSHVAEAWAVDPGRRAPRKAGLSRAGSCGTRRPAAAIPEPGPTPFPSVQIAPAARAAGGMGGAPLPAPLPAQAGGAEPAPPCRVRAATHGYCEARRAAIGARPSRRGVTVTA